MGGVEETGNDRWRARVLRYSTIPRRSDQSADGKEKKKKEKEVGKGGERRKGREEGGEEGKSPPSSSNEYQEGKSKGERVEIEERRTLWERREELYGERELSRELFNHVESG